MTITINEQEYQRDGCCILRSLLTADEVAALKALMTDPDGIRKWAFTGTTKMSSFQAPGDDVLGRVARSRKLHEAANAALGGTPNLHHIQATFKEPHSVYEFAWHQVSRSRPGAWRCASKRALWTSGAVGCRTTATSTTP